MDNNTMLKKVLVFGSNGQLGTAMKDMEVLGKMPYGRDVQYIFFDRYDCDITKKGDIISVIAANKADVVLNLAAYTDVDNADSDAMNAHAINTLGPMYLAEVSKTFGMRMVHISSDYVFSGDKGTPYSTTEERYPINTYGLTKYAGEVLVEAANSRHSIIRTSWLYSQNGHNFVSTMLNLSKIHDSLTVVNDQYGNPTSCDTLINFIDSVIDEDRTGIMHCTDQGTTTWCDFAKEIFQYSKAIGLIDKEISVLGVSTDEYISKRNVVIAKRPMYSVLTPLECDIQKLPNWKTSLHKVLDRTLERKVIPHG